MIRFVLPALVVAGLCATATSASEQVLRTEQQKLARALEGLTPGAPERCVLQDKVTELRTFEGEILYVAGRGKLWRNKVVGTCQGLARGDIPVIRSRGGAYCSGDLVQTRAPTGGMLSGSCSLGEFVPYTK